MRPLPAATGIIPLSGDELATARSVVQFTVPFSYFNIIDAKTVKVYPIKNEINIAMVPSCVAASVIQIISDVFVAEDQFKNPVEFALEVSGNLTVASSESLILSE
jgi:hypothetical protein